MPQTFIKTVNYNHMMPTRYTLDIDMKTFVSAEATESSTKKIEARKVRYALPCPVCTRWQQQRRRTEATCAP